MPLSKEVLSALQSAKVELKTSETPQESELALALREVKQEQGISEEPSGFLGKAKELVTGEFRTTPELEALPGIGELPELNEMSFASLRSAFNTVLSDPSEAAQALKANFPDLGVRQDEKGNFIVRSGVSGEEFAVNKPGLDTRDIVRGGLQAAMFAGPGRLAGLPAKALASAGTQAAIETGQALTGGEFDAAQIPLAGATEAIAPALGGLARTGKGVARAIRPVKGAPLSALEQSVKTAEKADIPVMTSDVFPPKGRLAKLRQKITEDIPLTGTTGKRVVQQEKRLDAIEGLIDEFGASDLSEAIDEKVVADFTAKRLADKNKYTDMKWNVINKISDKRDDLGLKFVKTKSADKFIDKNIQELLDEGGDDASILIKELSNFKQEIKNKPLRVIETKRRALGDKFEKESLASVKTRGQGISNKLYHEFNDDMGQFIKEQGEPKDFVKWKVANKRLSMGLDDLRVSAFKNALDKGEMTPGVINNLILGKEVKTMKRVLKDLTPEGRKNAKALIFQDILDKSGAENITSAKFTTQIKKRRKQLGTFLDKEDKEVLDGLVKTLELTKRAPEALASPSTGQQLTSFVTPGALLGAGAYLDPGLQGFFKGGTATLGIGVLGRLYESKPVRNILIQISKAPKGKEQELLNKLTPLLQAAREQSGE